MKLPVAFSLSPDVSRALAGRAAVVALESTVVTHGLPFPENLELARQMEIETANAGAQPATIAVLDGRVRIGLEDGELERLATVSADMRKISLRDLGPAIAQRASGGTTVAATIFAAERAGIRVMATGGIGGVHQQPEHDVSADLPALGQTPIVVVCAGAKSILDLAGTLERLETLSVPVIGFRTQTFPAFYARSSGLDVPRTAESFQEAADMARAHWEIGARSAVLVVAPPPEEIALPADVVQRAIDQALAEAAAAGLRGQGVTPFLLERVSELSGGESLQANLGLLRNNARIAAQIAVALAGSSPGVPL